MLFLLSLAISNAMFVLLLPKPCNAVREKVNDNHTQYTQRNIYAIASNDRKTSQFKFNSAKYLSKI